MRFEYFILAFFIAVVPLKGKESVKMVHGGSAEVAEVNVPKVKRGAVKRSVREFLEKYPHATLQDIYKNNFQDYFGPAHIMGKRENVIRYLNSELEQMEQEEKGKKNCREEKLPHKGKIYTGYYDPCGWRHNYYQVSLRVIKDGFLSVEEFADAFMAGGGAAPEVTLEWMDEWEVIKGAVKEVAPDLEGFAEDASKIDTLLKSGDYVVHHSKKYEEIYYPHYRIIRREIFENVILPKILVGK